MVVSFRSRRLQGRQWLIGLMVLAAVSVGVSGPRSCSCRPLRGDCGPTRRAPRHAVAGEGNAAGPSPEAWREFRAQLISGGLKLTTDEDTAAAASTPAARRVVAPKNEELLKQQNEVLWNEYIHGAWAHEGLVEAGGLLCRWPLAAQLVREMRGVRSADGSLASWGKRLHERLGRELPQPTEGRSRKELFESWSKNTNYCYKIAEALISEELENILSQAQNRRLDPSCLSDDERSLLLNFSREQELWQAVCLVTDVEPGSTTTASKAVVINRPFAKHMDRRLAEMLVGQPARGIEEKARWEEGGKGVVKRCIEAFGEEAAVYLGGPEEQVSLVHGLGDLPGARELAPGTRIFTGGAIAAIDGVLEGRFSPLDFRWIVGCHRRLSTASGEWCAVACARPIALKQCLALPKPLWHEVMELCGGDHAVVSRVERTKRKDLEDEG